MADRPKRDDEPPKRGGGGHASGGGHGPGARHDRGSGPGRPPGRGPGPGPGRGPRGPSDRPHHAGSRPPSDRTTTPGRTAPSWTTGQRRVRPPARGPSAGVAIDPVRRRVHLDRAAIAPSARVPMVPDRGQPVADPGRTVAARPATVHGMARQVGPSSVGRPAARPSSGCLPPSRSAAGTGPIRSGPGTTARTLGSGGAGARPADRSASAAAVRAAGPAAARRPRRRRRTHRRSPTRRGGVRRAPPGASAAGRPAASAGVGEARPPRDEPAAPDHRARGRHPHRAGGLRRSPGRGPRRRAAPLRDARGDPGPGGGARRGAVRPRARLTRGSAERRDASAQRRGSRRPRRPVPDPSTGAAHPVGGQGVGGCGRAPPARAGRRPGGCPDRPPWSRAARRRGGSRRAIDGSSERSPGSARDRRRQRGPGPGTGSPPARRSLHAHPDAWRRRFPQRGGGGVDPAVRGGRPTRSRRPRGTAGPRR